MDSRSTKSTALGRGSHAHGGAPAQMDQSRAFGIWLGTPPTEQPSNQYRCLASIYTDVPNVVSPNTAPSPSAMTLGLDG
eukprot:scaffold8329_cov112-Isochrysis_galbana.AAC.6